MFQLFNTFGRKMEKFTPMNSNVVNIFTCGPSVYQRAHIGNHRTFLFEDILVRYLRFLGYRVRRGMIFTDVEDKAIAEAEKKGTDVKFLTEMNIETFAKEMHLLKMTIPDYLGRASEAVDDAVAIIEELLARGIAYRYRDNIYFDPLKYPFFGTLYGLDMRTWPKKRRRFHKDTYPGMRWNRGDFILWHGCADLGEVCWDSSLGPGRPSWNIQDASVLRHYIEEPLSIYCGGVDNLIRHHDYTMAVLESIRPYPMARYWMHCRHLFVEGKKMSKSLGNVYYTDTLLDEGFSTEEIRFFLIYGHYRENLNYSKTIMKEKACLLRRFRSVMGKLAKKGAAIQKAPLSPLADEMTEVFTEAMDNDLNVRKAFDGIVELVSEETVESLSQGEAAAVAAALRRIDSVLEVML